MMPVCQVHHDVGSRHQLPRRQSMADANPVDKRVERSNPDELHGSRSLTVRRLANCP
jgi:hypothetical protein